MNTIEEQVLDCFPSGSYALSALLRLMDIVESECVPTAAVECRIQPRLLINPHFIKRHANTPERLLMLVMHELHHVLLGHTTLFKMVTKADNFVFDCVINALISRMFPHPDHLEFLTDFYSEKKFPECLLRPPSRWNPNKVKPLPLGIQNIPKGRRPEVEEVYQSLYSETGITYQEIYEILPRLLDNDAVVNIPLLGGHGKDDASGGNLENRSPILFDIVRSIVEEWPQPPDPIRGRSMASIIEQNTISVRPVPGNREVLRKLLKKVANMAANGQIRRLGDTQMSVPTPVPLLDRRSTILRALGSEPLFYTGSTTLKRRTPLADSVHVYVDVSGSMDGIKDAIYGALVDCREWVHPSVHLFSNSISDVSHDDLRKGIVKTTGGTDIACIADHMETNNVRRACIITDGWVGGPRGRHHSTLMKAKLSVAYAGEAVNTEDLSNVTNHVATLHL
jgi:predicted metal-dependent peptidase